MLWLKSHIVQTDDVQKVANWYEQVFEKKPYFVSEKYVWFDSQWCEFWVFFREASEIQKGNNVEVYWWVDDIYWEFHRLQKLWAIPKCSPVNVWWGIEMATVIDPFENVFGIIYNANLSS